MSDLTSVDDWITSVLAHTDMPMARRAETAEEWRAHLDQLVRDKRNAGMPHEQAVFAALESFGQPEDLRRRLRREQRMRDRRNALAEVRKGVPLFLIFALVMVVIPGLVVRPASIHAVVIGGLRFLVSILPLMALITYFSSLLTIRIKRERPRAEFDFLRRWRHWTVVSLIMVIAAVWFPLLTIAAVYPILADLPHFRPGLISFWQAFGRAMFEAFGGIKPYLAPVMLMVIALALTLYERSRCIDTAKEATIHPAT